MGFTPDFHISRMGIYSITPPFECRKTIFDLYPDISQVDLFDFFLSGHMLIRRGRLAATIERWPEGYRIEWQDFLDEDLFTQIAGDLFHESRDPASEFLKLMRSLDEMKGEFDHYRRQGFELLLLIRKKARLDRSGNSAPTEKPAAEYQRPIPNLGCLAEAIGHEQPDEFIVFDGAAAYFQSNSTITNKPYGGYHVS